MMLNEFNLKSNELIWLMVLTPLQLKNTLSVINKNDVNVVFYDEVIDRMQLINEFPKADLIIMPHNIFRKKDLIASPGKYLKMYRNQVLNFKCLITPLVSNCKSRINLYCGSDKNIYLQTLANVLNNKSKLKKLISIDEGIGHYCNSKTYLTIKKLMYRWISWIFLGVRYDYIDRLGSWKLVSEVWVRWPDLVQCKNSNICYRMIPIDGRLNQQLDFFEHSDSKKVLLLSSPLTIDRRTSLKDEKILFYDLINEMIRKNYQVTIKLHPRDCENKFETFFKDEFQLNILSGDKLAEDINYWEYSFILSFGSSVILDVLDSGYPPDRVVTLDLAGETQRFPLFNITQVFYTFNEFKETFHF